MLNDVGRRVLVIDDHQPWRRKIASVLAGGGWQVIGECADGLEAIRKAKELRPDVMIVDVELPGLNGLEAARRIVARDSSSRILFVSAHRSRDIVAAAFGTGASGYIVKSDVGDELLPAMNAIAAGKAFIGATLTGLTPDTTKQERHSRRPGCHEAGFYSDDALLLEEYVRVAATALSAGRTLICAAAESRHRELRQRLQAQGLDVALAVREGRYVALDVADMLSSIMVEGWPDEGRFWKAASVLVAEGARASRGSPPLVAACGDGAATLLSDGMGEAALRLEQLWSELAAAFNVDVFCGYPEQLHRHGDTDVVQRIREEHSAVYSR